MMAGNQGTSNYYISNPKYCDINWINMVKSKG
jgi:hypothetical protein